MIVFVLYVLFEIICRFEFIVKNGMSFGYWVVMNLLRLICCLVDMFLVCVCLSVFLIVVWMEFMCCLFISGVRFMKIIEVSRFRMVSDVSILIRLNFVVVVCELFINICVKVFVVGFIVSVE